jgi:hypothetical protein
VEEEMKNNERKIKNPENLSASESVIETAVNKAVSESKSPEELKKQLREIVYRVAKETRKGSVELTSVLFVYWILVVGNLFLMNCAI